MRKPEPFFGDLLFRADRPNSATDFNYLRNNKFEAVVSVEWGWWDFFHGTKNYQDNSCNSRGMVSITRPMGDFFLSKKRVLRVLCLLVTLERHGFKTLLHCASGVDRTGIIVLLFRVLIQGWSFDDAYAEWVKTGRHWWYDGWAKKVRPWIEEWRPIFDAQKNLYKQEPDNAE